MGKGYIKCKACGNMFEADTSLCGQLTDCPKCNKTMEVPFQKRMGHGFGPKTKTVDRTGTTTSRTTFAGVLCVIGILVLAYFLLIYDTSIQTGMGRVVNLGLQQNRTLGVVVGVGLLIVATILAVSRGKQDRG